MTCRYCASKFVLQVAQPTQTLSVRPRELKDSKKSSGPRNGTLERSDCMQVNRAFQMEIFLSEQQRLSLNMDSAPFQICLSSRPAVCRLVKLSPTGAGGLPKHIGCSIGCVSALLLHLPIFPPLPKQVSMHTSLRQEHIGTWWKRWLPKCRRCSLPHP